MKFRVIQTSKTIFTPQVKVWWGWKNINCRPLGSGCWSEFDGVMSGSTPEDAENMIKNYVSQNTEIHHTQIEVKFG